MSSSLTTLLLVISLSASHLFFSEAQNLPPLATGLSWNFFDSTCPKLESIVRKHLRKVFREDIVQAGGLLRLHFHDCFVQGCDSSVLLDGSVGRPGEKTELPNLTLRNQSFIIIEDLRKLVHKECGRIVSCSDITALAARDSVYLSGGPDFQVPLGRRDGTKLADINATLTNLAPQFGNTTVVLGSFTAKRMDATDLVALSGAHTIGKSHCSSFTMRLYPTTDPTMDKTLANNLKRTCPTPDAIGTTNLDIRSPTKFDNKYFLDLMNRQGLFTSDQDLFIDSRTKGIVTSFALNETLFFEKFVEAMIKMGQLSVLTGTKGEIRKSCNVRNSGKSFLSIVVDDLETLVDF